MDSAERKRPGAQREYTYIRVYTYTRWRARSKESISQISRATAMGISFPSSSPRTCRPREPAPSLPAPAPWEWGGAVSSLGGRGTGRCRSFTTVPVHNALSTIFLSPRGTRPSPPICQTLRAARGENSRSAITAVLDYTKLKKEKDGSRVISHSRRIVILKSAGKEGRKEGRRFVPSCKEASFAGTILPPSSPPSSPIEPALSTRDVWRWRSLINSKDRPRPPCGKLPLPPLSFQSRRDFYSTLAPGLPRKEEKNTIVALRWRAYKERKREKRNP